MNITIDDKHIYRVDGIIKPGTTDVIKCEFRNGEVSPYFNEFYSDRGHVIHEACALLALGRYKQGSIDPRLSGYIESADKAMKKYGMVTEFVEQVFFDPVNDVCGTKDWGGKSMYYPGKKMRADWKAGVKQSPDWELQGAAYVIGEIWDAIFNKGIKYDNPEQEFWAAIKDYIFADIKLHQDGKCGNLMPVTDLEHYAKVWPHIAGAYHFKTRHGVIVPKHMQTKGE